MPELPEAETIKKGLEEQIKGFKIIKVEAFNDYRFGHPRFVEIVEGSVISGSKRLGKIILISLENPTHEKSYYLAFHLALTGRLVVKDRWKPPEDYPRLIFTLEKDGIMKELRYRSIRMFGYSKLVDDAWVEDTRSKLGKEPFDMAAQEFKDLIKGRKTGIKSVLLDQSLISGLGNIYANDALWIAKIHPGHKASELSITQIEDILAAARKILKEGIKNRGSTIKDYVDSYGNPGFQQKYFRVYGKRGDLCRRCKTPIEFKDIGGRGTFFCPNCQKLGSKEENSLKLL